MGLIWLMWFYWNANNCKIKKTQYTSILETLILYVVYLVIHVINQIMNAWKLTKNVLYFIQYATLKYNHIEYQSFTYWCILVFLFYSYLHSNKIPSIKSDPVNNITKVYRLSIFFFSTFYDLQYMYIYTLCCLRTI